MPADKSNLQIEANNVKINLLDIATDFDEESLQFSALDMAELDSSSNSTSAADNLNLSFTIPKNVLMTGREGSMNADPEKKIRLSIILYESTKLYKLSNETTPPPTKLNINCTTIILGDNPVIGNVNPKLNLISILRIFSMELQVIFLAATIQGANTDYLAEPVTFKLRKPTANLEYKCVYWDPRSTVFSTHSQKL